MALAHLSALVARRPHDAIVQLKLGVAKARTGDLEGAVRAIRRAIAIKPDRAESHLELGRALKRLGQRDAAEAALLEALRLSSAYPWVKQELVGLSIERNVALTPEVASGRKQASRAVIGVIEQAVHEVREWAGGESFVDYAEFRRRNPVPPPPAAGGPNHILQVVIFGDDPAALRATLISLIDQRYSHWRAIVPGDGFDSHPVGSLKYVDDRVQFVSRDEARTALVQDASWLCVRAGDILDVNAIGWFAFAAGNSASSAIYCDHEEIVRDDFGTIQPLRPILQEGPGPTNLETTPVAPVAALVPADAVAEILHAGATEPALRAALCRAALTGSLVHVPRILISRPIIEEARHVHPAGAGTAVGAQSQRILCVIPTRDHAEMLQTCVESLVHQAAAPDLLDFVIVEHRSQQSHTIDVLKRLSSRFGAKVLVFDEPFNWSRMNNLAAGTGNQPFLVFANNDVEAISSGWDNQLVSLLRSPGVGAVGARLLYPDRTIQHAGIALGVFNGRPMHEAKGVETEQHGPNGRWARSRETAAVTGAFLATTRQMFTEIGGFDALQLPIAYNDIDYCLAVRARGSRVLYCPEITLIHHESKTRGQNDTVAKVAWDDLEFGDLYRKWGTSLLQDPTINPQWMAEAGNPFDRLREPPMSVIKAYVEGQLATG